ncbi:Nucleotide-sugar transporter family protein [Blastocystis sp. ATCC 50177/Nand II]|uniref:Nucleotide-sugar transporter family protein n=1 Tax=Blastocystis sp. subtype 1 (strain ATCC 50177 / NandII) TaxID=478820 RepID=A0A196S5E5_BLAHN|nr:Nucleotide-sugar transporter family protein [Blastocystis sp. ATCC 50177/Nand II]
MKRGFIYLAVVLSLVTHACKGTLSTLSKEEDGRYSYSTELCSLTTEMAKLLYSFLSLKWKERRDRKPRESFTLREILFMSLPALLNEMVDRIFFYLHYALNDELVIQAFESLEIVIIGVASFFLLGKRYSATHWCSLVLVCTAVMSMEIGSASSGSFNRLPLLPSLIAVVGSGLEGISGVLTEKILKRHEQMDISLQNIWIYFWGALLYMVIMLCSGFSRFVQNVTFTHFNRYAFLFILSESIRGLSSSFLFKYADSVVESFTSCTALILASFIVSLILQKEIGYPVITGKTPPLLHVCILPGRYKSVYCHIPV